MQTDERVLDPLGDPTDGHILTRAIIDTIHEPLIVLDGELRVIAASRSFYRKFNLSQENTQNEMFYSLGNGQWNIKSLRTLLEQVILENRIVEKYEVEHDSPFFGKRTMLINAREIQYEKGERKMLLSFSDNTDQRAHEVEREALLAQKDLLLKEMKHRIANSLQLIASILLIKAEMVETKEIRSHLEDAHERIMSIATVQQQLDPIPLGEKVAVAGYLTNLCKSLSRSMIGGRKPITLRVYAGDGSVTSDTAVSFGLLTTELVINALKHAFPEGQAGEIIVTYEENESGWALSVEDNGVGETEEEMKTTPRGLGTSIVGALANQLHAIIRTESTSLGTKVSIIHTDL